MKNTFVITLLIFLSSWSFSYGQAKIKRNGYSVSKNKDIEISIIKRDTNYKLLTPKESNIIKNEDDKEAIYNDMLWINFNNVIDTNSVYKFTINPAYSLEKAEIYKINDNELQSLTEVTIDNKNKTVILDNGGKPCKDKIVIGKLEHNNNTLTIRPINYKKGEYVIFVFLQNVEQPFVRVNINVKKEFGKIFIDKQKEKQLNFKNKKEENYPLPIRDEGDTKACLEIEPLDNIGLEKDNEPFIIDTLELCLDSKKKNKTVKISINKKYKGDFSEISEIRFNVKRDVYLTKKPRVQEITLIVTGLPENTQTSKAFFSKSLITRQFAAIAVVGVIILIVLFFIVIKKRNNKKRTNDPKPESPKTNNEPSKKNAQQIKNQRSEEEIDKILTELKSKYNFNNATNKLLKTIFKSPEIEKEQVDRLINELLNNNSSLTDIVKQKKDAEIEFNKLQKDKTHLEEQLKEKRIEISVLTDKFSKKDNELTKIENDKKEETSRLEEQLKGKKIEIENQERVKEHYKRIVKEALGDDFPENTKYGYKEKIDEIKKWEAYYKKNAKPEFVEKYLNELDKIYKFAKEAQKGVYKDSIFEAVLKQLLTPDNDILHINKAFSYAIKDEYYLSSLDIKNYNELNSDSSKALFARKIVLNRTGYNILNSLAILKAYSACNIADVKREYEIQIGDETEIDNIYSGFISMLEDKFGIKVHDLPVLNESVFDERVYRKSEFSNLTNFNIASEVQPGKIYDLINIGFVFENQTLPTYVTKA